MKKPTYSEIHSSFTDCMIDLESWAAANPEGVTPEEKERLKEYGEMLDRIFEAAQEDDKIARFLAL